MTTTTHYISTSIEHWKFLKTNNPMDLQPKPVPFFRYDDVIIYKPYGDTYNERLLKMKIVGIVDGNQLGSEGHTLLLLVPFAQQEVESNNLVDVIIQYILSVLFFLLLFKIIASIYRLFF